MDRRKKGTQLCIRSCDRPGRTEDTLQDTLPLTLAPRLLRQWSPRNQDLPKNLMLRRGYIEPSCQRKKTSVLEGDFHAVLTAGQATLQDRLKLTPVDQRWSGSHLDQHLLAAHNSNLWFKPKSPVRIPRLTHWWWESHWTALLLCTM